MTAGTQEPYRAGPAGPQAFTAPKLLISGVIPLAAAIVYSLIVGVRNEWWLAAALALAVVLIGVTAWYQRFRRSDDGEAVIHPVTEAVAMGIGGLAVAGFATWIIEGPAVPLGLLFALLIIRTAYVLPSTWRVPAQTTLALLWGVALWAAPTGEAAIAFAHVAGGIATGVVVNATADRQITQQRVEAATRADAVALARLLTSVQQVNNLAPQLVLQAVADGLVDVGFSVVEIRRFDEGRGVSRLVAHAVGEDGTAPPEEIPLDLPLITEFRERWEPIVIEGYQDDPRPALKSSGYDAAMLIPLTLEDGARASLAVAVMSSTISALQREAALLLGEHAAKALERSSRFEADTRVVEDLRRLEDRTHDFVSTASHELRTPLTVISGLGQTLRRHWDSIDDDRRNDLLQRIDANADRLATMVRHLLDTSALERGELHPVLEPVPLAAQVHRLLDRLATVTAAYPVEVTIADDVAVAVDPALFDHVLENLLGNVARHTPQGTRVTITAELEGERVRVGVADEGPGIESGDLPHVLDRFYRGGDPDRRPSGGLGLGLALSQQVVRAHGGELEVVSEPGVGTNFSFSVPRG